MKTIEIIKVEEIEEDVFFTVEWVDEGTRRQEVIERATLIELAGKVEILYNEYNEELESAIDNADITYIEIADEEDEYDVYYHGVSVKYGEVTIDIEGDFVKTYKTYKGATKYAHNNATVVLG